MTWPSATLERVRERARGVPPPAVARALSGWSTRAGGWLPALAVFALALGLRLWHLGTPREFSFDETYYAKHAWSLLNHGYVRDFPDDADQRILDGDLEAWSEDPELVVHPEVGKWMIAIGIRLFGMDPFGWRFSAALAGALLVLVMCRLVRRMTGSTLLGCVAGVLLTFDGMHFVLSRLALLDIFLALFLMCGVACVVNDRFWLRARLARLVPERPDDPDAPLDPLDGSGRFGPAGPVRALLWRPWLLAGGVMWGLAVGTKWTALYPLAVFGILVWVWSAGARRMFGVRRSLLRAAVVDGVPAFGYLVLVAAVTYVISWTGWLVNADVEEEAFSSTQYTQFTTPATSCDDQPGRDPDARWPTATEPDASGLGEVVQSLRSLWYYHQDVYVFHTQYLNCADHPYQSDPRGWLVLNRPVGVHAENGIEPGDRGCRAAADSTCLTQVLILGTPVLWWAGAAALLVAALMWVGARDWRYGVAVAGALSTWLPWWFNDERPIFLFYAMAILPFTIIALSLALGQLIGRDRTPTARRTVGVVLAGTLVVLVILNFAWFYPIFTGEMLTRSEWLDRIWFDRWI
ncbi:phospholipid carrier-dependent glycosyltransferase [Nocardioides zeae]|uniref:Polyprenol-phosphate-mannose--protein mannosyltransferase n=1 Tax=Nocardioides imazamoxiresistens TaxID=3231893 RepID=A0ABU3PWM3_9ACTN|nr:phospholipid carrier-dependent glycosyltransferase [Nocardioides zeae]MDT9593633.1 phospholipid carrier-dependent glycosyltransferase [Nocardioides zeae]